MANSNSRCTHFRSSIKSFFYDGIELFNQISEGQKCLWWIRKRSSWIYINPASSNHLKATGLVLPSPKTRDSVMSMLSERIIGTMCLKREDGEGVPIIYCHKQKKHVRTEIWKIQNPTFIHNNSWAFNTLTCFLLFYFSLHCFKSLKSDCTNWHLLYALDLWVITVATVWCRSQRLRRGAADGARIRGWGTHRGWGRTAAQNQVISPETNVGVTTVQTVHFLGIDGATGTDRQDRLMFRCRVNTWGYRYIICFLIASVSIIL